MRGFIGKWRVAVGAAPLKKMLANNDALQQRYVYPVCAYRRIKYEVLRLNFANNCQPIL